MALNLSALPDYVSLKSKEFVKDAVLGAQTIQLLKSAGSVQFGIKSKAQINTMSASLNVQSDLDCSRNPIGDSTIGRAEIEVHPLKDEQNYCPKKFENKWTGEYLSKGSNYTELLFAQDFMQIRADKIAEYNENHIWKGDTNIGTGTTAYNKYDGFVKLIKASAAKVVSVSGATSVPKKLKALFLAAPLEVSSNPDARIFIGQDMYNEYVSTIDDEKFPQSVDNKTLRGTVGKLEPVNGLNGTNFALVATPDMLVYGTDMLDEEDRATLEYSIETKQIYMDFHWKSGVQVVRTSQMAYAQL